MAEVGKPLALLGVEEPPTVPLVVVTVEIDEVTWGELAAIGKAVVSTPVTSEVGAAMVVLSVACGVINSSIINVWTFLVYSNLNFTDPCSSIYSIGLLISILKYSTLIFF